jgi:hypothetical protein
MNTAFTYILKFLSSLFSWLRSVYSESDGSGSSTRVHMAGLIAFILGVGISFAVSVHHKYVTIEQFDAFLTSGATFIVTTCGALYGINKVSSWAENNQQSTVPTTTVPPQGEPPQ